MAKRLFATHVFDAPAARVAEVMADPQFHASLRLPDVEPPEVVSSQRAGSEATVVVRFEFSGSLDPIARRVLGRERVSWVQTLVVDLVTNSARLDVKPDIPVGNVACHATLTLAERAVDQCVRTLEGSLSVGIPLVGGRAESALAPGILRRIDLEADALADAL